MKDYYNKIISKWFGNVDSFVIVRTCAGCILPKTAKLIGQGEYNLYKNGIKDKERYYDYQLNDKYIDSFIMENQNILIKYQLLDIEKTEKDPDEKNPDKTSWKNEFGYELKK